MIPPAPTLSIIIVSWNVTDLVTACIASIIESMTAGGYTPDQYEIVLVDSGSTDGTPGHIIARFPAVRVLAQADNVGFTRGNNIGLGAARGDHLLLLNPDTCILADALRIMLRYLIDHPAVGIVGPHTLNDDGSHQSTRRRFPTLLTALFESTWLQPYAPRRVLDRYYVRDVDDHTPAAEVNWVQGSALMTRRAVYAQIGGLDEGFIMYSEELDWCRRAVRAGWRVVYLGEPQIVHYGGKSTQQAEARTHLHFQRSKLRYFRKHHGVMQAGVLRAFLLAGYLLQIGIEGVKGVLGHKSDLRWQRVRLYWHIVRSGL